MEELPRVIATRSKGPVNEAKLSSEQGINASRCKHWFTVLRMCDHPCVPSAHPNVGQRFEVQRMRDLCRDGEIIHHFKHLSGLDLHLLGLVSVDRKLAG